MAKPHSKSKIVMATCRACHTRIRFYNRPNLFDIITCPECEEDFEVIGVSPVVLDWPSDAIDEDEWPQYIDDDEMLDGWYRSGH